MDPTHCACVSILRRVVQYCEDPPARIVSLGEGRINVEIMLPEKPVQIAVDPDQVLPDRDPTNNFWKTPWHVRVTPFYTFLDETSLTTGYDRWNLIIGPWLYGPSYAEAWFTRSDVVGLRAREYINPSNSMQGLISAGGPTFETSPQVSMPHSPIPFSRRRSSACTANKTWLCSTIPARAWTDSPSMRYIIQESSSLYTAPAHDVELFGSWQENFLPTPRYFTPDAIHVNELTQTGIHYHFDMLTPYWNPDMGAQD